MKKKIILAMLLLLGLQSFAYNELLYDNPNGICRMIDENHAVKCTSAGQEWTISYWDITLLSASIHHTTITIPGSSYVYDMEINGNYVYLCGTAYNTNGILVSISLNDLINLPAGSPINYYYEIVSEVNAIDKLTVYEVNGTSHLAAICHKDNVVAPYMYREHTVLHIRDFPTITQYELRHFNDQGIQLHDIVATDNYVAIIGNHGGYGGTAIWRCDKTAIFSTPMIDEMYYFPNIVSSYQHAAWLSYDEIAIAHLTIDPTTYRISTQIRFYKLGTMDMYNAQEFILNEKGEPYELTYMPLTQTLIMLQQEYGPIPNKIVYLKPHQSRTYLADYLYHPDDRFASIDCYRNNKFYVAQGKRLLFEDQTTVNHLCMSADKLKIHQINRDQNTRVNIPGGVSNNSSFGNGYSELLYNNDSTLCHQP